MANNRLEEAVDLAHGRLDVERLDVLPLLLEERDEEVDGKHDVGQQLVVGHLDVADGDTEAENLLELELDGALDLGDLLLEVLVVRDGGGELAGLGETGAQQTRDLLDQSFGGQEGVVLLGELLDELLVLVELLQVLDGHELEVDELGTVDIGGVGQNAHAHAGTGHMGKLDGTRETLVALGVVVLEADLELDGLVEVSALVLRSLDQLLEGVTHAGHLDLAHLDVVFDGTGGERRKDGINLSRLVWRRSPCAEDSSQPLGCARLPCAAPRKFPPLSRVKDSNFRIRD